MMWPHSVRRRSNATHQSTIDPEAEAGQKEHGQGSELILLGQRFMGEPSRSSGEFAVEPACGYAERNSAPAMLEVALPGSRRITLETDKGCISSATRKSTGPQAG
jgi:hypothetical protein